MKKILITGSNGLLGQAIKRLINDDVYDIYAIDRTQADFNSKHITQFYFDLTDTELLYNILKQVQPNIIIHCAALTNVDECEMNHRKAYDINVYATTVIVDYARAYNAKVVFISTDCIFDGIKGKYSETDNGSPINYYGKTKFLSECYIIEKLNDYIIARTTVIYGHENCQKKDFVHWIIELLQKGIAISIVDGQWGNPTYNEDLAYMLMSLIKNKSNGIFNVCGSEYLNRYEFAKKIATIFDFDSDLIVPIPNFALVQKAPRPNYGGFNIEKIISELRYRPMNCAQGLIAMKGRMK